MVDKPTPKSSLGDTELDKAEKQFEAFEENIKELTLDRMNTAPKLEMEPQTQLSQNELRRSKDIYLKPKRAIGSREKFNEKYREAYNYDKEYVCFQAENKEVIGETITMWTKPYAGLPAEEWEIPVNKPIFAPRYLAEQIRKCTYHRLIMDENRTVHEDTGVASFHGQMVADKVIPRLTAEPVNKGRSVFVSSNTF
jgi:hypothetical protein